MVSGKINASLREGFYSETFTQPLLRVERDKNGRVQYIEPDTGLINRLVMDFAGGVKAVSYTHLDVYKRQMQIGKAAAQNRVTLVSGMAKGIDSFAHLGALRAGGKTIAVLGCGVDICYPRENEKLYAEIAEKGLLLSQFPPGMEADVYKRQD